MTLKGNDARRALRVQSALMFGDASASACAHRERITAVEEGRRTPPRSHRDGIPTGELGGFDK